MKSAASVWSSWAAANLRFTTTTFYYNLDSMPDYTMTDRWVRICPTHDLQGILGILHFLDQWLVETECGQWQSQSTWITWKSVCYSMWSTLLVAAASTCFTEDVSWGSGPGGMCLHTASKNVLTCSPDHLWMWSVWVIRSQKGHQSGF